MPVWYCQSEGYQQVFDADVQMERHQVLLVVMKQTFQPQADLSAYVKVQFMRQVVFFKNFNQFICVNGTDDRIVPSCDHFISCGSACFHGNQRLDDRLDPFAVQRFVKVVEDIFFFAEYSRNFFVINKDIGKDAFCISECQSCFIHGIIEVFIFSQADIKAGLDASAGTISFLNQAVFDEIEFLPDFF